MDLLEELELEQHGAPQAVPVAASEEYGDFLQQQIRHLQTHLQQMWTTKRPNESVVVPYMWLYAQVLLCGWMAMAISTYAQLAGATCRAISRRPDRCDPLD